MERVIRHLGELAVGLDHQWHARCLHRDLDQVEIDLVEVGDLLERRLDHRLGGDPVAVLAVQVGVQRPPVDPDADRHAPVLGLPGDGLDVVGVLDVAGVEAQAVDARLEGLEGPPVLVVDVGHDRHGRTGDDAGQPLGRLRLVAGAAHDVGAGRGEGVDLLERRLVVGRLRDRHRLDRDRGAAADGDVAHHDPAGLASGEALGELHEVESTAEILRGGGPRARARSG